MFRAVPLFRGGIPRKFFFGTKQYRIIGSYFCLVYIVVLVQLVPMVCSGLYNGPVVRVVVLFIFFTLSSILAYPSLPLSTIHTLSHSGVVMKKHVFDMYKLQRKVRSCRARRSKSEMNRDLPAYRTPVRPYLKITAPYSESMQINAQHLNYMRMLVACARSRP